MRLYDRSSRTADYADLDPAVRVAIEQHADKRLLGPVAPTVCVLTRSVSLKPRGGLLGRLTGRSGEAEHDTVAVLLPHALIVATSGSKRGTTVMSTRLADITAITQQDPALVVDPGVSVASQWGGPEPGSYYVALGDDPAGRGFHESLRAAVTAARS